MFSIADLLERAKAHGNIESDYRLALVIGITHSAMTHYRQGRSLPNEKVIAQLCALSGDDPDVIAAQIQAARSKTPEAKSMWLRIAARMQGAATTAILSVCFAISFIATDASNARASTVLSYHACPGACYALNTRTGPGPSYRFPAPFMKTQNQPSGVNDDGFKGLTS